MNQLQIQKSDDDILPIEETAQLPELIVKGYLDDLNSRPNFSVEANFMFLPIASYDRHSSSKLSKVTHSVPILKDGAVITTTLSITSAEVFDKDLGMNVPMGLPGSFDMQLLFCLMDLWDEQGRPEDGKVHFRLATICRRLNVAISGRTYSEIQKSIYKLASTHLTSVSSFYSEAKAGYVNTMVDILKTPEFASLKTRKSSEDTCSVKLSDFILSNLEKNYSGKISRKVYQSLDIGFSQRLFTLFQYKFQVHRDREYVDFELMDLAALLPMSGKLFPSKVKDRLTSALTELNEKKVLKHDFIKVGNKTVLRLRPFDLPADYLLGKEKVSKFLALAKSIYNIDPLKFFGMEEDVLKNLVEKNPKEIEFSGRKYSFAFHVLDVALFQVARTGYKPDSPTAWLTFLFKKPLDYPIAYKPLDICFDEQESKTQVSKALILKSSMEQNAEDELFQIAVKYVDKLSPKGREHFENLAKERNPLFRQAIAVTAIADILVEKLKLGIDLTPFVDQKKLTVEINRKEFSEITDERKRLRLELKKWHDEMSEAERNEIIVNFPLHAQEKGRAYTEEFENYFTRFIWPKCNQMNLPAGNA